MRSRAIYLLIAVLSAGCEEQVSCPYQPPPPAPDGVLCGSYDLVCPAGTSCFEPSDIFDAGPSCVLDAGTIPGNVYDCDGPEDCPEHAPFCCIPGGVLSSSRCARECEYDNTHWHSGLRTRACHRDRDCSCLKVPRNRALYVYTCKLTPETNLGFCQLTPP
jgi:hypothetical protein